MLFHLNGTISSHQFQSEVLQKLHLLYVHLVVDPYLDSPVLPRVSDTHQTKYNFYQSIPWSFSRFVTYDWQPSWVSQVQFQFLFQNSKGESATDSVHYLNQRCSRSGIVQPTRYTTDIKLSGVLAEFYRSLHRNR